MASYRKWTELCRSFRSNDIGSAVEFDGLKRALLERIRSAEVQLILHRARESNVSVRDSIELVITELFDDNSPDVSPPVYTR
jgi:hypothetical protein